MKKYFCLYFILISISFINAQESLRFTIDELIEDGYFLKKTVNTLFYGWYMQFYYLDGYYHVIYERFCPYGGQWNNWEIKERTLARSLNLNTYYENMLREYYLRPLRAKRIKQDGVEYIYLMNRLAGNILPIWWNDDGNSFNVIYGVYKILNDE